MYSSAFANDVRKSFLNLQPALCYSNKGKHTSRGISCMINININWKVLNPRTGLKRPFDRFAKLPPSNRFSGNYAKRSWTSYRNDNFLDSESMLHFAFFDRTCFGQFEKCDHTWPVVTTNNKTKLQPHNRQHSKFSRKSQQRYFTLRCNAETEIYTLRSAMEYLVRDKN